MATPAPRRSFAIGRPSAAWLFGADLGRREIAGVAAILGYAFIHLTLIRTGIRVAQHHMPAALPFLHLAGLAGALLFARFRMTALPPLARYFLTGLALLATVYAVAEPFDFPVPDPAAVPWMRSWLLASRLIAIACGIAAIWRPAFLLPALLYGATNRALMIAVTGVFVSNTDFMNVLEAGLFASSIGFSVPLAGYGMRRFCGEQPADWIGVAAKLVVAATVGGHLGSYFHSGLAKLSLDGGAFAWMFDNHTQDGILIGIERGTFPLAAWPGLTQRFYDLVSWNPVPGNVLVVVVQLAAAIAMLRRRLLMGLTLLFDLFHLGVYLIYGLLFWKWVFLNLVIFGTFARCKDRFTPAFTIVGVGMTLFGTLAVWTAHLAWYDSANLLSNYVEAETADGKRVRVPSAAFGTLSYAFSHGLLFVPPHQTGHFPNLLWGTYRNYQAVVKSRRCELTPFYAPGAAGQGSAAALARLVQARQAELLRRVDGNGRYNVYLYPHHHYPSPFAGTPFASLDLRSVVRYRWVEESVCLSLVDGRLNRRVIKRDEYDLGPTTAR